MVAGVDRLKDARRTPVFLSLENRASSLSRSCVDPEAVLLFPSVRLHPVEPDPLYVFCLRAEGQVSSTLCDFP